MKIQPLLNNILVESIIDEKTKSGLIIPLLPGVRESPRESGKGKVISVGQGIRKPDGSIVPLLVKKGDIILFSRYSPVKIDEKDYLITKEEFVLAILKDEKIKS